VAWRASMAVIAAGSGGSLAYADIIVTEGMEPWYLCGTCHSLDGNSAKAGVPKLGGPRAAKIGKKVAGFRDVRRGHHSGQMQASASYSDDDDLAKTAAYFASLPPPPPDGSLETNGEEWRRGARLYQDGDAASGIASCSSCHDNTESKRPDAPLLKAQHAAYLAKQLGDWRSGERQNDLSQTMPAVAAKLSDRDISALATFLASQPRLRPDGAPVQ